MILKNLINKSLKIIISFCVGIFIITYLLRIPFMMTDNRIVNEYYIDNFTKNIPLDFIFVICYFIVAKLIITLLNINEFSIKLLIIALTTAIITGGFCYYFINRKASSNFFSRWFHIVGYKSVIYDVILLSFIYCIYVYLDIYANTNFIIND